MRYTFHMPAITILSPYSGRPVKVRDQDLGRAVRDDQGKVFYIVDDPEHGLYAARTRKGSDKDLQRYQQIVAGEVELEAAQQAQVSSAAHDATGVKRRNPVGLLLVLVVLLVVAAGAYVLLINPALIGLESRPSTDPQPMQEQGGQSLHPPHPGVRILRANNPAKSYADFHHTSTGLRYKTTHTTEGPLARAGSVVTVRYTAKTLDGQSLIDDASQTFVLASGEAIRAFDEGLAGRREGEQLQLFVPRGHSANGSLPGIDRLPDVAFLMDIQIIAVRTGVTWIVEQPGERGRAPAGPGDRVKVRYTMKIEGQDEIIDATAMRGEPLAITLGQSEVIRGLELGLIGMRPGEERLMTIPPYLAYGDSDVAGGMIPAGSVLSFRITLIEIEADE